MVYRDYRVKHLIIENTIFPKPYPHPGAATAEPGVHYSAVGHLQDAVDAAARYRPKAPGRMWFRS